MITLVENEVGGAPPPHYRASPSHLWTGSGSRIIIVHSQILTILKLKEFQFFVKK